MNPGGMIVGQRQLVRLTRFKAPGDSYIFQRFAARHRQLQHDIFLQPFLNYRQRSRPLQVRTWDVSCRTRGLLLHETKPVTMNSEGHGLSSTDQSPFSRIQSILAPAFFFDRQWATTVIPDNGVDLHCRVYVVWGRRVTENGRP